MAGSESVSFIHLSDIHFSKYSSDFYDVDSELRNELLLDIEEHAKTQLTNVRGILVCGDIAYSGQELEYRKALTFLKDLCDKLEIPEAMVFCVPGNHDANQSVCKSSRIITCVQDAIEASELQHEIDRNIHDFMHDPHAEILFEHLSEYNRFASKFQCAITPDKPYWDEKIILNEKYTLRIHGLNSVVISSAKDHAEKGKERPMVIGQYQVPKRAINTITLTLCHHPPECWKDPDDGTARLMKARSHIQLYGHKHVPTVEHDNYSLVIGSGAVQPSRGVPLWVPYYNWINFNVSRDNQQDCLEITIYPRIYDASSATMKFTEDSSACDPQKNNKVYKLKISESWEGARKQDGTLREEELNLEDSIHEVETMEEFINKRILIYNFMSLSHIIRNQILNQFGLIEDVDREKSHHLMLDEILKRAVEKNCLQSLWDEVNKRK